MTNATDYKKELEDLMLTLIKEDGSDLHISEGRPPVIRVSGLLIPLVKRPVVTRDVARGMLQILLSAENKQIFIDTKEVDFAYDFNSLGRFRGNAFLHTGYIGITLRLISNKIRTLEELNLPPILETFAHKQQGFFLVVGPTGQGKSTTLAAIIDIINNERLEHIITIEHPIEYIYKQNKSIIDQREVLIDTPSFHAALNGVFRQDIDVLLIGEMRDPDTIATAVTAAETGHLVFSTLHTNSASQTVQRIIDSFSADQQNQIRIQLAGSLTGIFSQRLIPRIAGGLVPAYELLINNSAVANLIRENKTHELNNVIETSSQEGMIDFNRSLIDLVKSGEITVENAYIYSNNPRNLATMI